MMQEVRRRTDIRRYIVLRLLVDTRFQDLFIPLSGFFSPFPHGTCSLSVDLVVFSLGRWSSQFPAGFHVSRRTQVRALRPCQFRLRGYHPLWPSFPTWFSYPRYGQTLLHALQPRLNRSSNGLGCSHFAHRYYGNLN
jgi:hypothetical protein